MSAFKNYCKDVVDEFVQTVLIIDDGAGLKKNENVDGQEITVTEPSASFNPLEDQLLDSLNEDILEAPEEEEQLSKITHHLDTLSLTNAFYDRGIVAGLYQPQIAEGDEPETFAKKVLKVSAKADVIILDWMLVDHNEAYSQAIVKNILEHDKSNGGRLRTIVIYTGETDLHKLRDDLWTYLNDESLDKSTEFQINAKHLNIVFYNKKIAMSAIRPVSEVELPDKALEEFAVLVDGLVPAFAMKATATIRQYTGALLAKFNSSLDSGYLAHRALLPHPDDSEVLMLENYASYLRNILALAQVDHKTLGYDTIKNWVEENYSSRYQKALLEEDGQALNEITLNEESFLRSFQHGYNEGKEGLFKAIQKETSNSRAKKIVKRLNNLEQVVGAFGKAKDETLKSSRELACTTAFRRTFRDLKVGLPYLTQGSLIKSIDSNSYLLCVMPKCDTARVPKARKFLFAQLIPQTDVFDLVAPDPKTENAYIHLKTNLKFFDLEHIEFKAKSGPKVQAFDDESIIMFESENGNKYQWIGDLEDLDAQTKVSSIVGDFNRVGVDEIEWVRRRAS